MIEGIINLKKKTRLNLKTCVAMSIALSLVGAHKVMAQAQEQSHETVEEIIVSGEFEGRKVGETILGTTILKKDDIERQMAGTIGETLRRQPGISSTFFGPGASRPIIRGLGGDRIRVLDFGLGSIDASSTSPDHGVAVDPALAERIEILRGTAMLQYGSSAAGGIINVIDGRLPTEIPEKNVMGGVRYGHSTVDNGDEVAGALNFLLAGQKDSGVVLHLDGFYRKTDDYNIPGFAESKILRDMEEAEHHDEDDDHDEEDAFGFVENSATETKGGSVGLSYVFKEGFFGINVRKLNSLYGIPGGHAHLEDEGHDEHDEEGEGHEEEVVKVDLDQIRIDMQGELRKNLGLFDKAKFRFGFADYEHKELEGDEVGTTFANKGWEGRLDLVQKGSDYWSGSTGVQIRSRDFSAIGAEAFVPPSEMMQFGIYDVQSYSQGDWRIDFGGRYENTNYKLDTIAIERKFDGFSFSVGAGYSIDDNSFFGVSIFKTSRAPSSEELFSNGPHLATGAFELGNPDFGTERALGAEATYSYTTGPFSFVVNGFVTSYDDFIYESPNGAVMDGLPVFEFLANDAKFYGFETKAEVHVGHLDTSKLGSVEFYVDAQMDVVRAKLNDVVGNENLPRIPSFSALLGAEVRFPNLEFRTEVEHIRKQTNITDFELPTDDFTLWNLYLTVRPFENKHISLQLRANNLTNKDARSHTSFLKDLAPLPGRDIKVSLKTEF